MAETKMAPRDTIMEVQNLDHVYPNGFVALRDINLQISTGDFVGFIGQNGSGKTTLAKHFVGLLRATKGQVLVEGENVRKTPVVELARKIGYVFQNADDQIFSSSVVEEVSYGPKNMGFSEDQIADAVEKSLNELGILHLKTQHPLALSWGDRQKVAIASVLANGPQILILDEPTTGQDLSGGREILRTCLRLNEQGKTIIVITHNMELVAEYCKSIYLLYQGEILAEGPADRVFLDVETLRKSYITPPQVTRLTALIAQELPDFPTNILTVDQLIKEVSIRLSDQDSTPKGNPD